MSIPCLFQEDHNVQILNRCSMKALTLFEQERNVSARNPVISLKGSSDCFWLIYIFFYSMIASNAVPGSIRPAPQKDWIERC